MLECICMRTTVELRDDQREKLGALAARRGLRGYSTLIQEAVDAYLRRQITPEERLALIRSLRGSISEEEGERIRERIRDMRSVWRHPS